VNVWDGPVTLPTGTFKVNFFEERKNTEAKLAILMLLLSTKSVELQTKQNEFYVNFSFLFFKKIFTNGVSNINCLHNVHAMLFPSVAYAPACDGPPRCKLFTGEFVNINRINYLG
jgi:hypothetical protein